MVLDDEQYQCLICGCILQEWDDGDSELAGKTAWWADVRLLCDPDDEVGQLEPRLTYNQFDSRWGPDISPDPQEGCIRPRYQASDIEVHVATHWKGPLFYRLEHDGTKLLVNVDKDETAEDTFDGRVYLPIHAACLEMAQKVFATRPSAAQVNNLRGLWTVLRWRHGISAICRRRGPGVNMADEHHYFMPWWDWYETEAFAETPWSGPSDIPAAAIYDAFAASPLGVQGLTAEILRNLKVYRPSRIDERTKETAFRIASLPQEILDQILAYLGHERDILQVPTRLLPQALWKDQLKGNNSSGLYLLPWLWDIDSQLVDAKVAETCPGGEEFEWDWERLVRQLNSGVDFGVRFDVPASVDPYDPKTDGWRDLWTCTGYHSIFGNATLVRMHNRRRIWQLLEEMFVGDVVPWPPSGPGSNGHEPGPAVDQFIRLHWYKSGEIAEPRWIPSIDLGGTLPRRVGCKTPNRLTLD